METQTVRERMLKQIEHMARHSVIRDRRYLDDEQLVRSEQLAVLEEIFNTKVREAEVSELSSHFAGMLRGDHPCHLAIWGKTGTGKTMTLCFFLNLIADMAKGRGVELRHEHLDISTPRPCFRALNDLACLLGAAKRYKHGISLEELMVRIETHLADFKGYLVLFVDEVDNVRDREPFLTFLVRRLPQRLQAKLVLIFVSNRLDWCDQLNPRIRSFLKMNELVFEPYDAADLQHILRIRIGKALRPGMVGDGVVGKIAALASRDHGDARQAVALLARSAYVAEKAGSMITLNLVDEAARQIEQNRYVALMRSAPRQLQAAMAAVIDGARGGRLLSTAQAYEAYQRLCAQVRLNVLTYRAFSDLLAELDLYSLIDSRIMSRGRYGRCRQIRLSLPQNLVDQIARAIRMSFT